MSQTNNQADHHNDVVHETEALVLSCMDYRLIDDVIHYMDKRGMRDKYDQIILAGASIGALTSKRNAWGKTFWQHVQLARELHGIQKLIVIDHRDCGACKGLIDQHCVDDPDEEVAIHRKWMKQLAQEVAQREPSLKVETLFMELDGSVVPIETN